MAFPSNTGTSQDDLQTAWQILRTTAGAIKAQTTSLNSLSLAGVVGSGALIDYMQWLLDRRADLVRYAAVPGLVAYVREQIDDPVIDIAAEYLTMRDALDAVVSWMVANFPQDASDFLLAQTFNGAGRTVDRTFTTVQLATFRTNLQALLATID